jgi:Protein of unknown function (DUF3307)
MIFLLLFAITVKHWIADFVIQFEYMVEQKGTYGLRGGIEHALVHGVLTGMILAVFTNNIPAAVIFGLLDSVIHYHIDYVKARWGTRDANTQKFWIQLGADQLAHYSFYIWLIWILQDLV